MFLLCEGILTALKSRVHLAVMAFLILMNSYSKSESFYIIFIFFESLRESYLGAPGWTWFNYVLV